MKRFFTFTTLFVFLCLTFMLPVAQANEVHLLEIDAPIQPVTMRIIQNAIEKAEDDFAEAIVIQLDTPGGLMESSRGITKAILNSHVPVIVYVAPEGARAGSAGVFITMAAHIAAMAPSTNIGAATPVGIGGGGKAPDDSTKTPASDAIAMRKKVTNDAVAQVRAMAERRGRNADWAEKAVREAASITANEALEINVVDMIAENLDELLNAVDGKTVATVDGDKVLETAEATIVRHELSWREKLLNTIANPNLAYLLLLAGLYGLIFELYNPGAVIPGVIGVIALILAFFAMQTLPVNWAGLLLIVAAVIMFLLEIKVPSYGFLTFGGIVSLVLGSIMLFDSAIPALRVSWSVIVPTVIVTVLFFVFAITMGIKAQRNKITTGSEGMVGEEGEVITALDPQGRIKVGSEFWNAETDGDAIAEGEKIEVVGGSRLRLKVKRKA